MIPPDGRLLVVTNGAYGERMIQMASHLRIPCIALRCPEDQAPNPDELERLLKTDSVITHVAMVHCETTTGILNPILEIGKRVKSAGKTYIVDAMSSFGAIPINFEAAGIDFLISSANKCLEGVPGFSFVLGRRGSDTGQRSTRAELKPEPGRAIEGLREERSVSLYTSHAFLAGLCAGFARACPGRWDHCPGSTLPAKQRSLISWNESHWAA